MKPPSEHELRAALWQARLLDASGSTGEDLQLAHRLTATEGRFPAASLEDAQRSLLDLGLVVATEGKHQLSDALAVIVALDDPDALALLRRYWEHQLQLESGAQGSSDQRELIGSVGEELVAQLAQAELQRVGRSDLAQQVQRVSLVDDGLGYDVQAPTLHGTSRMMEVKSSSAKSTGSFGFFLSRNEHDVGVNNPTAWSLVACIVGEGLVVDDAHLLGWAPASALRLYLPEDGNGRWTEAFVRLPQAVFTPGLPPAV